MPGLPLLAAVRRLAGKLRVCDILCSTPLISHKPYQQLSCNKELKTQPGTAETLLSIYVSCGLKLFPSFLVKVLYEFDFSKGYERRMSQFFVSSWLVSVARLMFCPRQSLGYHDYITPMMMEIWWDHQFVLNITLSTAPSAYIITSPSVLTLQTRTSRAPQCSGVPAPKIYSHQELAATWLVLVTSGPQNQRYLLPLQTHTFIQCPKIEVSRYASVVYPSFGLEPHHLKHLRLYLNPEMFDILSFVKPKPY